MRELKFRVWGIQDKSFLSQEYLKEFKVSISCDGQTIRQDFWGGDKTVGEDVIVQQYTGLKDKNNVEIYEGDIVSGICLNDGPQICVVGFDTFGIFYTKIKFYPCEEWDNVAMLAQEHNEIVGNIFENSELLNQ